MRNKTSRIIVLFFVFGFILTCQSHIYCNEDNVIQVVSPSKNFELYKPLKIEGIEHYKDGGTVGFVIKDSKGTIFPFCLDGRMRVAEEPGFLGELKNLMRDRNEPYHIYFGSTHPEGSGAQEIPIGGKEEESIIKILENILSEKLSDEQIAKLKDADCYELPREEFRDCFILNIIKKLKDRQILNVLSK